jgi:hypothetical protein
MHNALLRKIHLFYGLLYSPTTLPDAFEMTRSKSPPHHTHRRMTLPTDLTVTICGPLNTETQKKDFNRAYEQLAALDCHYITATVQILLRAPMARMIAVRASRDEFITAHGLVALKWEENNQKRAIDTTLFDDLSSTGSEGSNASDGRSGSEDQLGIAKLWASKVDSMRSALNYLRSDSGVVVISTNDLAVGDYVGRDTTSPTPTPSPGESTSTTSASLGLFRKDVDGSDGQVRRLDSTGDLGRYPSEANCPPPGLTPHRLSDPRFAAAGVGPGSYLRREDSLFSELSVDSSEVASRYSTPPLYQDNSSSLHLLQSSKFLADHAVGPGNEWEKGLQRLGRSTSSQSSLTHMLNEQSTFPLPSGLQERPPLSRTPPQGYGGFPAHYPDLTPSPSPTSALSPIGGMSGRSVSTLMESENRGLGATLGGIAMGLGLNTFGTQRDSVPSNYGQQRADSPHTLSPNYGPQRTASPQSLSPNYGPQGTASPQSYSPNRSPYPTGSQGLGVNNNMYDQYLTSLTPKQLQQQQQQQAGGRHGVSPVPNQFIESRILVHWPHPSFRFMFLGEPLKSQLSELLHKHRVKGVGITTPFRDKGNPSACLSIEGKSSSLLISCTVQRLHLPHRPSKIPSLTYLLSFSIAFRDE